MLKQQVLVGAVLACFGLFAIAAEPKAVRSAGAASAVPTSTAGGPDTDEIRRRNEERLRNATEQEEKRKAEEEKRTAALAEAQRSAAEEKRRLAKLEQEKKAKLEKEQRERQCVFKPVMSDEEIAKCRTAYR